MSEKTNIQYVDSTANAVIGCSKVSDGCKNCYAKVSPPARAHRAKGVETWGDGGVRVPVKGFEKAILAMNSKPWVCENCHSAFKEPCHHLLAADSRCPNIATGYHRRRIFANSLSDFLDPKWPVETLAHFLDVLRRCDQCNILLLTKRPELFAWKFREVIEWLRHNTNPQDDILYPWVCRWANGNTLSDGIPTNIWIGCTVENQQTADERIPHLLHIPAAKRFLSIEPILGKIDLDFWYDACEEEFGPYPGNKNPTNELHWVIVGGESGPHFRKMEGAWMESIANQCTAAKVPLWVKQDSGRWPGQQGRIPNELWKRKELP